MKYFFILILNILTFNLYAQDMCDVFWDEIRKETNNLELYDPEYINFKGFGFDIVDRNYARWFDIWGDDSYKEKEKYLDTNSPKLFNTVPNKHFWNADATIPNKNIDGTRFNLCKDDLNCYEGKTIQELLDVEEFIVIDYFYQHNYGPDYFTENEYVDVKNLNDVIDKLNVIQNYIITEINGKKIDQYSLFELFLIFYTEQTEKINFQIYAVDRSELSSNRLDSGLFLIDVDVYPHTIQLAPIEIKLSFNESLDLSTINKELKFSYDAEFLWHRNDLDKIADEISKDYMGGEPFYCSLNYNEWLDYGLIAYLPFIDTDYREKIQNTDEIIIHYEYWPDQGTYAKISFPNTTITKNFDFNLNNFPFDRQKNRIYFGFKDVSTSQNFIILDTSIVDIYNSVDEEWEMYRAFFQIPTSTSLSLHFEVERNPNYYLFKVYLPILILMVLLYASYFIPAKQIESRLTLTVVTFLALIAYIFVIDDLIPKLSYMTIMDYFVILSFTFAAVPNLWAIYAFNYFNKNSTEHPYFRIIPHITLLIYLLFVVYIFYRGANIYPESASSFLSSLQLN